MFLMQPFHDDLLFTSPGRVYLIRVPYSYILAYESSKHEKQNYFNILVCRKFRIQGNFSHIICNVLNFFEVSSVLMQVALPSAAEMKSRVLSFI